MPMKQQKLSRSAGIMDKTERRRLLICFFAENALPFSIMEDQLFKKIAGPEFHGLLQSRQSMTRQLKLLQQQGKKNIKMVIEVSLQRGG